MYGRFVLGGLLLAGLAAAQVGGPGWIDRAWDLYRTTEPRANPRSLLVEALRGARELRDSPESSEAHAYVQTAFDGLIRSGAVAPLDVLVPFEDGWPAETVIMMTRLDAGSAGYEEALLEWRDRAKTVPIWAAVSNLLYRAGSQRFISKLVAELQPRLTFVVQNDSAFRAFCGGAFGCTTPQWKLPAGLPPIGVYYLLTEQNFAAEPGTAIPGPVKVVYGRAAVAADGNASASSCDAMGDAPKQGYRIQYLAEHTGTPVSQAYDLFLNHATLVWAGRELAAIEARERMEAQGRAILDFVNAHRAKLGKVGGTRLQIAPFFTDVRDDRSETLPEIAPLHITLP